MNSQPGGGGGAADGNRRGLRQEQHDDILGLLMLLAGVALFVGPFVVGQPDAAKDAHVNELVVGLVVVPVAARRILLGSGVRSDLLILVAGAWLIASPFVIGLGNTVVGESRVWDVTLGTILVVLALVSLVLLRAARKAPPEVWEDTGEGRRG